jgi:hypothetical protein
MKSQTMTSNLVSTTQVVDHSHGKSEDGHHGRPQERPSYWRFLAEKLPVTGRSTRQTRPQDFPSDSCYMKGQGAQLVLEIVADNHKGHHVSLPLASMKLQHCRWSSSSQLTSLNVPLCQDKPSSWLDHDVTPDYLQSPTTGSIDHDCDDSLSASFRSVDSIPRVPSRSSLPTFVDSDSSILSSPLACDRPVTSIGRAIRHA